MIDTLKRSLHRIGFYPLARHLYRRLRPSLCRERSGLRRFYDQLIQPGDLCFDIGANVGQTTEALLACGARVVAVEPNPACLPSLRWQFARRATLVPAAVGASRGSATLHFRGTDSTASLRGDWPYANPQSIEVEVVTLDDLIARHGRPRLCKVDVEGFELEVFKGLSQPIPIIYYEIHRKELARGRQVLDTLSRLGRISAVNLTDMDNGRWLFDGWATLEVFAAQLEEKMPPVANAVVRMEA